MSINKSNLALVRQCFMSAAFSHKVQECAAERKEKSASFFKNVNIVIVTSVLALLILQTTSWNRVAFSYIGASLSGIEIVLLIVQLSFNFEREATAHKNSALKYMSIRERYKSLIADIVGSKIDNAEATRRRDELHTEYQLVSDSALQTTDEDYDMAMVKLKITADSKNVWSDRQIDGLLPKALRVKG